MHGSKTPGSTLWLRSLQEVQGNQQKLGGGSNQPPFQGNDYKPSNYKLKQWALEKMEMIKGGPKHLAFYLERKRWASKNRWVPSDPCRLQQHGLYKEKRDHYRNHKTWQRKSHMEPRRTENRSPSSLSFHPGATSQASMGTLLPVIHWEWMP